jgi:hypothetical protein
MITTSDGHTIEIKGGSYHSPENVHRLQVGVRSWLLVDGKEWYCQHFRNGFILRQHAMDAENFTFAEWIEYCGDDIEHWQPEIAIGVDNVRIKNQNHLE